MDDFRRIFYGVIIGFMLVIITWVSFVTFSGCGPSLSCPNAVPTVPHTPIPSLEPATMPALKELLGAATSAGTQVAGAPTTSGTQTEPEPTEEVARPSNPGGPGDAVNLTGDPTRGQQVFAANCQQCHGTDGKGGVANPGSADGSVPPLNPIDPTIKAPDYKTFASNVDLFDQHGSTPEGPSPTFVMPAWGDKGLLTQQQIADVVSYIISLNGGASAQAPAATSAPVAQATGTTAASAPTAATTQAASGAPKPSNPGGPGQAIDLVGDPAAGAQIFATNCQMCHGADGKGGVPNPGSTAGTVPTLNPINPAFKSSDPKVFATNIDLFDQHGSTPAGPSPSFSMPAWGDKGALTQQQIADVVAYIMSLNK